MINIKHQTSKTFALIPNPRTFSKLCILKCENGCNLLKDKCTCSSGLNVCVQQF